MRDYLSLGATPANEDCAQVGSNDYHERARKECNAFRDQLLRQFGPPKGNARLVVKSFAHDFGSYLEVAVTYDDNDEEGCEWAFSLENNTPGEWDEQARLAL